MRAVGRMGMCGCIISRGRIGGSSMRSRGRRGRKARICRVERVLGAKSHDHNVSRNTML